MDLGRGSRVCITVSDANMNPLFKPKLAYSFVSQGSFSIDQIRSIGGESYVRSIHKLSAVRFA